MNSIKFYEQGIKRRLTSQCASHLQRHFSLFHISFPVATFFPLEMLNMTILSRVCRQAEPCQSDDVRLQTQDGSLLGGPATPLRLVPCH